MLTEVVDHVVASLTDAGVNAASDARNLSLPGVWVTIDEVHVDTLGPAFDVSVTLILVASGSGTTTALDELGELLRVVGGPPSWSAASIRLPNHSPDPLPALRGVTSFRWTP